MLGIDLGRLRQRLGLLQRRLDGLERGAPASISNTVPHATETSITPLALDGPAALPVDEETEAARQTHAHQVLDLQRELLSGGKRIDFDVLEYLARAMIEDVERRGGLILSPRATGDSAFNRAQYSVEFGRLTAFLVGGDERLQPGAVPLIGAALLADAPLLKLVGLDPIAAREQSLSHGEEAARLLEKTATFSQTLIDAVNLHHARLDGSGVPRVRGSDFSAETRLLTVAAAYLDSRWPRPDAGLVDPRRALREVLLEAESGKLDLAVAFRLLDISFYPRTTLVELSGGEWAEVVATQRIAGDLELASLPIVRIVRDSTGRRPSAPLYWNLAQRKSVRIVRMLTADEAARAA